MKTIWRNAHKVKRNGSQLETRKHRRDRKCDEYWDFSIRRVIDKLGEKSLIYRHNKKIEKEFGENDFIVLTTSTIRESAQHVFFAIDDEYSKHEDRF
jgi:hypothetical protein